MHRLWHLFTSLGRPFFWNFFSHFLFVIFIHHKNMQAANIWETYLPNPWNPFGIFLLQTIVQETGPSKIVAFDCLSVQLFPSLFQILHQACRNSDWFLWKFSSAEMDFNLVPNISQKLKWFQIFLSKKMEAEVCVFLSFRFP